MNQLVINQQGGVRKSNYELLRLLCMLMVLNLHSFSGYNHGEGILQALDFLRESMSICAVDTFILISGYFGIKWRIKGLFNLLFQVLFYSFAVYGVCVATGILEFNKSEFVHCFKAFYDSWGFITWYIILYFISPWLNAFAEKTNSKQLVTFILIFWLAEHFIMRSTGLLNYCTVYLIGRWISKVGTDKISKHAGRGYVVSTLLIFFGSYLAFKLLQLNASQMGGFIFGYSYASPFVMLQAVFLFLIFSKLNIQNRAINWCAASCLSIFLIHMHPAIKYIGYYGYTESLYDKPLLEHVALLVALMFVVFFGSIFIDKFRMFVSNGVYGFLSWLVKLSHINIIIKKIKNDRRFNIV